MSLFDSVSDPNVKISRERISPEQAREIAAASRVPLPSGTSDVSTRAGPAERPAPPPPSTAVG